MRNKPDPQKIAEITIQHGLKKASFSPPPQRGLGVSIAVGMTKGLSLEPTMHLLKAALLYADHVTLYSIPAFVFQAINQLRKATPDQRLALLSDMLPLVGAAENVEALTQLREILKLARGRRDLPKDVLVLREKLERMTKGLGAQMNDALLDQFGESSSQELDLSVKAGLVSIQPIGDGSIDRNIIYHFLDILESMTQRSANLPLLDEQSRDVLRSGIEMGLVERPSALAGSKHPSLAADFIERLPVIDSDMATILDVRSELNPHVKPFREAMIGFSKEIASQPWETEFIRESELLYHEKIVPEVQRIEDALKSNSALTRAISSLTTSSTIAGSAIGFGIGQALSVGAAAIATPVVGGLAVTAKAVKEHGDEKRKIKGNQLYFYYQASKK